MNLKTQIAVPLRRKLPAGTILNRHGKPVRALTAPAGATGVAERIKRVNAWRDAHNPLRGLTIARAVSLLEEYQIGRMADLQWAYHFLEQTDPDMIGLLENRVSRLLEMDYNIQIEVDADEKLGQEQSDCIAEKIAAIGNLYDAIEHLAMAPFRGFAHCEKWRNAAGEIFHLELVDQWNAVRDGLRGAWKYNPSARSTTFAALPEEALMPEEKFLFREVRRPINRYALLKAIRGSLSEKDWDAFNEIYNVPGGVVTGPPDVPEGDEDVYEDAARRVAEGGSGYLPHGSTYTPNKMPHDPATFEKRLEYLSKKLVLAGTGGMLTMLAESGSGTLAGSVHDEVFNRIARAEARRISEIFNRQLVAEILETNFPGQEQVAYFQLAANEETDTGDAVEQVAKLSAAGYQVDAEQVTEKTGWKVTLKPAAPIQIGPGGDVAGQLPVRNRAAAAAGREARFEAASAADLAAGDRAALKPAQDRVAALLAITDDAEFDKAYRAFLADLPALEEQCLGDKATAALETAFEQIIGTALVSGAAEAAEKRAFAAPKTPQGVSGPSPTPRKRS
jgi:phage gp29-like protein